MQSIAAIRSLRRLYPSGRCILPFSRATSTAPTPGAGSPAVHAEEPEEGYPERPAKFSAAEEAEREKTTHSPPRTDLKTTDTALPCSPSHELESTDVSPPNPVFQQKRRLHLTSHAIEDVACVGWDGHPLATGPGHSTMNHSDEQDEDYREYYKTHSPSPISEIEMVDTRKPITRATDGSASHQFENVMGTPVRETVDDALARAERMFREAAERGDPDSPQARALARMLGETPTTHSTTIRV